MKTTIKKTWRELEAEGVKRCCAMFNNGTRCRRRASDKFESSWCDEHGPILKAHGDYAMAAVRKEQKQ